MAKWKCDICNSEFDNFQAQGFDRKIYCPLCYYKHEFNKLQQEKEELIKWLEGKKQLLRAITDKDGYTHIDELISAKNNLCQEILSKLKESDK